MFRQEKYSMTTMYIPGTYKLDVDLSSDWSVEMRLTNLTRKKTTHQTRGGYHKWEVVEDMFTIYETTLPFDIEYVIINDSLFWGRQYCFYNNQNKELLERWNEEDAELREFFRENKEDFLCFLKIISPVDSWKLIC